MNLFHKRPLAIVLCISILALFSYSSGEVWPRVALLIGIPLLFLFALIVKSRRKLLLTCSVVLTVSILCSALYFDFWFYPHLRFKDEVDISAEVEAVNYNGFYNTVYIKTDNISDTPLSSHRLVMYLSDEKTKEMSPGCRIEFAATLSSLDISGSDNENYYASNGIGSLAKPVGDIKITSEGKPPLSSTFASIREHLRRRAISLSDESTGNLLGALLLGERSMLSNDVALGFMRVGITHLLALSGMHLAILTMGLGKVLSLLGISKKPRYFIQIIFTLLYMALTGFPISVMRAGIMLIITYLLFLFGLSHDSVTSLVIAVFVICLAIPYSVFDISLWLSAFATLGVLLFAEYSSGKKYKNKLHELCGWIVLSLLSSVFAICATFAICVFCFDGISILSPISTALISPIIELIMYLGTFMLLFGNLIPLGPLTVFFANLTEEIISFGSSFDDAYVTSNHILLKISVIAVTVLFYSFAVLNIKHKRLAICLICTAFTSVFLLAYGIHKTNIAKDELSYIASENENCFLIKDSGELTLIESASYTRERGHHLVDLLYDEGITVVDNLRFTSYSFGISFELDALSRYVMIKNISLPSPQNDDEKTILSILKAQANKEGCDVSVFKSGEAVYAGDVRIRHLSSEPYGSEFSGTVFELKTVDKKYVYMSSGFDYEDSDIVIEEYLNTVDGIIFSSSGKAYKKRKYFEYRLPELEILILDSKNLFLTQDMIRYYNENGCEVFSHSEKCTIPK